MANYEQILTSDKVTPRVRDERIDSVKYWLMVLVIAGHVLNGQDFLENDECVILKNWIYMFHMPLFVFISGYFSHKKEQKDFPASIWKLLEPLILFQVIIKIIEFYFEGFSLSRLLTPWWVLWYLLSLIYWRLMIQIIPNRILNNTRLILITTFCISIIAGFLPFDRFLSMQRTLSFMPFFFLGYCMKGKNLFLPNKYKPLCLTFLITSIIIPIFFSQHLGSLTHADPYVNYYGAISRIFVFCISIPISFAFINACLTISWVAKQGKYTMQYFILHALILRPFIVAVSIFNLPTTLIATIIYTLVVTIGIGILSYLPYFDKFTNPSSIIKDRKARVV